MTRTTINLADPVLRDLKRLVEKENKSMGDVASELLAEAMAAREERGEKPRRFRWKSKAMGAKIDLRDKDALYATLDSSE